MKYAYAIVAPQVYTTIMFGISIFLWPFLTPIPLMPGTPIYLQHPLFALEFFSLLSTAIPWIATLPVFSYSLSRGKIYKTKSTAQKTFVFSLALITIIIAIFGSIFFSKTPYYLSQIGDLHVLYSIPSDPLGKLYGLGILFCEGAWVIWIIFYHKQET